MSLTPRVQCRTAAEPWFNRVIGREGWQIQKPARRIFRPSVVADIDQPRTLVVALGLSGASPHQGFSRFPPFTFHRLARSPIRRRSSRKPNLAPRQHRLQTPKDNRERLPIIRNARFGLLAASDAIDEMFE
jgi:hypothetical protein